LEQHADDPASYRHGQPAHEPGAHPVGVDRGFLDRPRAPAGARDGRADALPIWSGDRAHAPAAAFVPAPRAAASAALAGRLASLRSVRFCGASVPTSVSLSSPRMNASTRVNAMSSWICWGGLFMK